VGCLQVNLMHHPEAFATLDEAFDPAANVAYAARFLHELFAESQDWAQAAAAYHSRRTDLGIAYLQQVLAVWGAGGVLASTQSEPERVERLLPAAPIPAPRPFAPPPLPVGAITEPSARADDVARLLAQTPDCATASLSGTTSWSLPVRGPSCGRSPFASTALLRRILAAK
jgi:Transglycosylase SLT domain